MHRINYTFRNLQTYDIHVFITYNRTLTTMYQKYGRHIFITYVYNTGCLMVHFNNIMCNKDNFIKINFLQSLLLWKRCSERVTNTSFKYASINVSA